MDSNWLELLLNTNQLVSVMEAYETGAAPVEQKVTASLQIYNEMMNSFSDYENVCLYDTIANGLPEFYKWYDCRFEPQNTILTLDYPIITDLSTHTGIDRILLKRWFGSITKMMRI